MNAGRASKGLGRMASHLPWVAAGLAAIYACVLLWSLFSSQTLLREAHHDHLLADGQRRAEAVAEFLAERRQSVVSLAAEREIGDYLANEALGMSERYGLNISLDAIERRLAEYLAQHTRGGRPVFDGIAFFGRDGGLIVGAGESLASGAPTVHGREVLVHIADDGADYRVQAPVVFRGDHQGMLVATGSLTALATTLIAHPGERGGAPSYIELIIGRDGSVLMPAGQRAPLPSALGSALEQLPERAVRPLERVQLSAAPARDLLAVRLPVSGTGLSVATLVEPDVLYGQTVSSGYIQALAVLPLVMIALALVFARQRRRSRHLHAQVRAVEGQRAQLAVDNEALAAEVARRQAAESRLQQQAEALVRSNAELEQLALVFSHSREGISLNAGDGTILEVNDAFCRMTGYTREELV
ncbi:MAG: PAS domain S-box protein, partial [Gammaproteobacteria bacterium]|nr:PAS domain S-box protein [Gammaproteobacteria bacterium]